MSVIAVVTAGGALHPSALDPERRFDRIIAVDGGLDVALAAGLSPTMLIGDLDSVSPAGLHWATEHGIPCERHPVDKDDTDTALALRYLHSAGSLMNNDLVLLGTDSPTRLDHLLATVLALGLAALAQASSIVAAFGATRVHVVHPGHTVRLLVGSGRTFSLLALHGACTGVTINGARWRLTDAALAPTTTLGISNVAVCDDVAVSVGEGVLTVIVPEDAR